MSRNRVVIHENTIVGESRSNTRVVVHEKPYISTAVVTNDIPASGPELDQAVTQGPHGSRVVQHPSRARVAVPVDGATRVSPGSPAAPQATAVKVDEGRFPRIGDVIQGAPRPPGIPGDTVEVETGNPIPGAKKTRMFVHTETPPGVLPFMPPPADSPPPTGDSERSEREGD
jgi:hypothetical protein